MTDYYLLEQLIKKTRVMRTAQDQYRKQPGNPKEDALKNAYLQERKRREEDVDQLLTLLKTQRPEMFV
jgi:hypothetical protein